MSGLWGYDSESFEIIHEQQYHEFARAWSDACQCWKAQPVGLNPPFNRVLPHQFHQVKDWPARSCSVYRQALMTSHDHGHPQGGSQAKLSVKWAHNGRCRIVKSVGMRPKRTTCRKTCKEHVGNGEAPSSNARVGSLMWRWRTFRVFAMLQKHHGQPSPSSLGLSDCDVQTTCEVGLELGARHQPVIERPNMHLLVFRDQLRVPSAALVCHTQGCLHIMCKPRRSRTPVSPSHIILSREIGVTLSPVSSPSWCNVK